MKAVRPHVTLILLLLFVEASADWRFENRIPVGSEAVDGLFHHLEGAGRKHIAVSENRVGVTWEDDSGGAPKVFLAMKRFSDGGFGPASRLSTGDEAYEPAMAAMPGGRFAVAWEQDGGIYLGVYGGADSDGALKLPTEGVASHASVAATRNGSVYLGWREQRGKAWHLLLARLEQQDNRLELLTVRPILSGGSDAPLLSPSLAANESGLYIAWEDRAEGHTRLKFSYSHDQAGSFSEPVSLNEFLSDRNEYDRGSGVTRVSVAGFGKDEVVSAWMDKRRNEAGYGIFGSLGGDGDFGPNEKIHRGEGDRLPHYNPSAGGNRHGALVVAWDDYRMGDSDIWLATLDDGGEWGANFSPTPASGPGEQSHASVALDEAGGLHLVWIERESQMAPTRLWYGYGAVVP